MDTDSPSSENEAVAPPDPAPAIVDVNAKEAAKRTSGVSRGFLIAIAVGIVAIFAMQVFTLISASQTDDQMTALEAQVDDMAFDVSEVRRSVTELDQKVDDLAAKAPIAPAASGASAAEASDVPVGWLPSFEQGQPDAALGVVLGDLSGPEYYTETELTVDPADGTARAWMVWAHWCPYCQEELPPVSEWYEANADLYPNVELISVTTSIDPSRPNPLEPYLDELQLPYPTIVDVDLSLAGQLGASAFPFWVFTGPDGTTLLRVAGLLGVESVAEIFSQLDGLSA